MKLDQGSFIWDHYNYDRLFVNVKKMDTPENRRDMPAGFKWTCCGRNGDDEDGNVKAHRSDVRKKKARKVPGKG